jgi:hypothetical protein
MAAAAALVFSFKSRSAWGGPRSRSPAQQEAHARATRPTLALPDHADRGVTPSSAKEVEYTLALARERRGAPQQPDRVHNEATTRFGTSRKRPLVRNVPPGV